MQCERNASQSTHAGYPDDDVDWQGVRSALGWKVNESHALEEGG